LFIVFTCQPAAQTYTGSVESVDIPSLNIQYMQSPDRSYFPSAVIPLFNTYNNSCSHRGISTLVYNRYISIPLHVKI
jgi:hypothetical protein